MSYVINKDQAIAMAYFLIKEYLRHQQDMDQIEADLLKLKRKWDIDTPDPEKVDPKEWVDI